MDRQSRGEWIKRAVIVSMLCIAVGAAFILKMGNGSLLAKDSFFFRDDFNRLDDTFWFVGQWETLFDASKALNFKNGIVTLDVTEADRGPFLLSKPIPFQSGEILTVRRRARMHYGNEYYTGGMTIFQTDQKERIPTQKEAVWNRNFGEALLMVEYVHNASSTSARPGKHVFRVLPFNWSDGNSIQLQPIFDTWFEETLTYDTGSGKITYRLGEEEKTVQGVVPTRGQLRLMMHNYGWYTGHSMKMDWVEIQISPNPDNKKKQADEGDT